VAVHDAGNGARRSIISKDSLLPIGVCAALVVGASGFAFRVGLEWNTIGNKVAAAEAKIGDHEQRLKLAEARLELWRRWLEVRLSTSLPEPSAYDQSEPAPAPSPRVAHRIGG